MRDGKRRLGLDWLVFLTVALLLAFIASIGAGRLARTGGVGKASERQSAERQSAGNGRSSESIAKKARPASPLHAKTSASGQAKGLPGVPRPLNSSVVGKKRWRGIESLRFQTGDVPAEVGIFYLDRLGEEWILIDSEPLTDSVQGWVGSFMSADFKKRLFIYAIPREITGGGGGSSATQVSLIVIQGPGD